MHSQILSVENKEEHNMKKNYQAPKTRIFKAEIKHMIAASLPGSTSSEDATDDAMGREGGSWFSED